MDYVQFSRWAYGPGSWQDRIRRAWDEHSPELAAAVRLEQAAQANSKRIIGSHIDGASAMINAEWGSLDVPYKAIALNEYAVRLRDRLLATL